MPPIWAVLLVFFYISTLLFVFCFSLVQLNLVYIYLFKNKKSAIEQVAQSRNFNYPIVTIQLPIYNELYVVERLLKSILSIDYPKNKLEIQVLDDSTDETSILVKVIAQQLIDEGFDVSLIQRTNRNGYKAGALAEALKTAKGEFIAIFDADFIISPTFLTETINYFQNSKIGMVQTRWLHFNENYSFLTQLQAFGLDAHFTIDQVGRNKGGYYCNFNGTGGIWRKTCISEAGGWSADCLTEDLDLSYRAQLKGWKFIYLENTGNYAELPAEIQAVKSQQFRWAKGAAECLRKLFAKIIFSKDLNIGTKIHAFFHLANSATYLGLIFMAVLAIPILLLQRKYPQLTSFVQYAQYFQFSFVFLGIYFWVSFRQKHNSFLRFLFFYPTFLAFMMGLSLQNSFGVLEGYLGKKSPFIRTPKFNILNKSDGWLNKKYVTSKIDFFTIMEGVLCFYFGWSLFYVVKIQSFGSIPFLGMLFFGYSCVFGYGIYHRLFVQNQQ